jgi:DNA-binding response OmpR family regulator
MRILLIEDEAANGDSNQRGPEEEHFSANVAEDGTEGFEKANAATTWRNFTILTRCREWTGLALCRRLVRPA